MAKNSYYSPVFEVLTDIFEYRFRKESNCTKLSVLIFIQVAPQKVLNPLRSVLLLIKGKEGLKVPSVILAAGNGHFIAFS